MHCGCGGASVVVVVTIDERENDDFPFAITYQKDSSFELMYRIPMRPIPRKSKEILRRLPRTDEGRTDEFVHHLSVCLLSLLHSGDCFPTDRRIQY